MMKQTLLKQGLSLLALSVALAGCPALDTLSGPGPEPTPTPTPTPSDDAEEEKEEKPGFAIKALGPLRVALNGPVDVEHGPITLQLHHWYGLEMGGLRPVGVFPTTPPPETYYHRYDPKPGAEGLYRENNTTGTLFFDEQHRAELAESGHLTFTIGGASPTFIRTNGDSITLGFPATEQTDLVATLPADGPLRFRKPAGNGDYSFHVSDTASLKEINGSRSATMSVTVSVRELDGTPSKGLTTTNFRILNESGREDDVAIQATETTPGLYRVVAAYDHLYAPTRRPQRRTLTVTHSTLTHTYTKETP